MKTYNTKLIILRGQSGSGKSTIAKLLRDTALKRNGKQKIALVEQDYLRRFILEEKETEGEDNLALIKQTVLFALEHNYHVILEGILYSKRYMPMLQELIQHCSHTYCYYLDVSFDETLRRHNTKPNAHEFGEKELRQWYKDKDLLGFSHEKLLPEHLTPGQIVEEILDQTKL